MSDRRIMNKLSYGNYDPSNADIAFSATNQYSSPASELETRKQLSYPLKEVKTFVNNTVSVDTDDNAVQLVVSDDSLGYRTTVGGAVHNISLGLEVVSCTQAEYDAMGSGRPLKVYVIVG